MGMIIVGELGREREKRVKMRRENAKKTAMREGEEEKEERRRRGERVLI